MRLDARAEYPRIDNDERVEIGFLDTGDIDGEAKQSEEVRFLWLKDLLDFMRTLSESGKEARGRGRG